MVSDVLGLPVTSLAGDLTTLGAVLDGRAGLIVSVA